MNDTYPILQNRFKPGGTTTLLFNHIDFCIIKQDQDPFHMCRWSWLSLIGKRNNKILMITALITGPQPSVDSENTTWNWQEQVLRNMMPEKIAHANPWIQCLQDLSYFINEYILSGHEIILATDANHTIQINHPWTWIQENQFHRNPKLNNL